MTLKTFPFDVADYFLKDEDPRYMAKALGAIARARGGITELSLKTGIPAEALFLALSVPGNLDLRTTLRVIPGLGMRLSTSSLDNE